MMPLDMSMEDRFEALKREALGRHAKGSQHHSSKPGTWTDERTHKAVSMWGDGYSAGQIAQALGHVTRNAVIGKLCRMGLQRKEPGAPPASKGRKRPAVRRKAPASNKAEFVKVKATKPRARSLEPTALPADAPSHPVQIENLTPCMCRFPIGDPAKADFRFCGAPADPLKPYCGGHMSTAYQAGTSMNERKR